MPVSREDVGPSETPCFGRKGMGQAQARCQRGQVAQCLFPFGASVGWRLTFWVRGCRGVRQT